MEAEKVMDSVKDWGRNRLNNPYFASVLVVWLYTNRIEVFGLFNFNDSQTIQDRVLWMQQQFHNKEIHSYFDLYIWKGFSGVVWFSLLVGIGTMLVFTYAQAISEVIYDKVGQYAVSIRAWNKPLKWVSLEKYEEMSSQFDAGKTNLIKRNQEKDVELTELREGKAVALKSLLDLKADIVKLEKEKNDLDFDSKLLTTIKEQNSMYLSGIEKLKADTAQIKAQNEGLIARNVELEGTLKRNKAGDDWNEKDKIQKEKYLQLFLESPFLEYFDEIMGFIRNHKIINDSVPPNVREYYEVNKLIVMNGNLHVMTDKGNEYYVSYLKTKKHNISIPQESNFKGVKGGVK